MKWLWDTHKQIVKPLSQTCERIWRAQACAARKSARVCVRWGVVCTPTVAFMAVATVWARNCQREEKSEKCARLQMESGFRWTWQQLKHSRSDVSVQVSLYHSVRDSGFVVVIADLSILCLATLESAILAIDGPKMKNSTTLGFLSMLRMKMTRKTSSSWNSTILNVVGLLDPMCLFACKCIGIWGAPLPWARWRLTRAFADALYSGRWHSGPACSLDSRPLM